MSVLSTFSITTVIFIILFLPGYIFVSIHDYFLFKKEKSQFEKTVQGMISSIFILLAFIFLDSCLCKNNSFILYSINFYFNIKNKLINSEMLHEYFYTFCIKLIGISILSILTSGIISIIRKFKRVNDFISFFTNRDYLEMTQYKFFFKTINKQVMITTKDKNKYIGILQSAPDNDKDSNIIISDPYVIEKDNDKYTL